VKCGHGGCRTDAVVILVRAERTLVGDYEPVGQSRPACRNHMAVLCEPDPVTGNYHILVTPITEGGENAQPHH
jgi:hypothetical protein